MGPPTATAASDTAVSRSTESYPSRRRIRANIAQAMESAGLPVVGARLQRLVAAYTSDGVQNLSEIPDWLRRRGDLIEVRSKTVAHDPRKHDWRTSS